MHIGIAADHGGFDLKGRLGKALEASGHLVEDYGAYQLVADAPASRPTKSAE
jgi:ribose 5-phosphate isomerase B